MSKTKYTQEEIIAQAKVIHGDKYDYSKAIYTRMKDKMTIICPIHGEFEQSPSQHITRQCGCPKCRWDRAAQTNIERYGVPNVFQVPEIMTQEVREKHTANVRATLQEKYGVDNISQLPEVQKKKEETCLSHYGKRFWAQTDEGKAHLSKVNSSEEVQKKSIATCMEKYGVANALLLESSIEARRQVARTKEYREKRRKLMPQIVKKTWATKKANGTTSSSKFEEECYEFLLSRFDANDIYRNYDADPRYPYHCDFYIKSQDLFIELNMHWTHGPHPFNPNSQEDQALLQEWQEKSATKIFYKAAIDCWTRRDVEKIECARIHELNYLILYNKKELKDFYENYRF